MKEKKPTSISKASLARKIGYNVYKYRIAAGLTQEELAEKAGVGASFIARIESGQKIMSVLVFYKLAEALHVSADMLFVENAEVSHVDMMANLLRGHSEDAIEKGEKILRFCLDVIDS